MNGKHIIGGNQSLNIAPIKYKSAWQYFLDQLKLIWLPSEIPVGADINCYKHKLNEVERHVFNNTFAQLSTMDVLAGDILKDVITPKITSPEHQMALSQQISFESIHAYSYHYCIDNLGLDEQWLWSRYKDVPEMQKKIEMSNYVCELSTGTIEEFILQYYFLCVCFEAQWFGCGFTFILALGRSNKMTNTCEMLNFIRRDELTIHWRMGMDNINTIISENYKDIDFEVLNKRINHAQQVAFELEDEYCNYIFSKGSYMGLTAKQYKDSLRASLKASVRHLDKRIRIDPKLYESAINIDWLDEMSNINKESNFFEKTVKEYQKVNLNYDEKLEKAPLESWDDPLNNLKPTSRESLLELVNRLPVSTCIK